MRVGAYSRLGAKSRLGAYSNKYDIRFLKLRVVLALSPPHSEKYCSFTEKCNANCPKMPGGMGTLGID